MRIVLENGETREDRTGIGTKSIFGYQMRFNLSEGFPLLTTKKLHFKSIVNELLWFLGGHTNNNWLTERGVSIWNEWADEKHTTYFNRQPGDLGPIYGHQWRNWGASIKSDGGYQNDGYDQINYIINEINNNPQSRRLIVSGWHPREVHQVDLPPCHTLFQFFVHKNKRLDCQLYQRSADVFLGIPFNIASYSLLILIIAQICKLRPGYFIHTLGDAHLYNNHFSQASLQLNREPRILPQIQLNSKIKNIENFTYSDFYLNGYNPYPNIKAPVAI